MKILVSGRTGQLAQCLVERAGACPDIDLIAIGRPDLDLLQPHSIMPVLERIRPDIVVSAAAYTAVDLAESEPQLAFAINAEGAGQLAAAAELLGAAVIHISTDYVFGGDKGSAYDEREAAAPRNVYGQSKLAGEAAVAAANGRCVILRTAWAHSPYGRNFIRSMLDLATSHRSIRVVADRFGSPTSMLDVADAILHMAGRLSAHTYGIYHVANRGVTNWAGLARQALSASRAVGGPWAEVEDIGSADYRSAAARPINTALSSAFFERTFSWSMPDWEESATLVAQRLATDQAVPVARRR